ncbi:MAG: NADH-quinone oxidoreductase subunit NuoK [Chlamydiae bacterium]|nr:NADH-quinone oxidoreductase subunit NuoK [Chlamydiota bacterium]MBI3277824.1 NADH-quinone oxidoreductase subunit NuoK [Chlamydiota bacterium]
MSDHLQSYLILSALLAAIGVYGFLERRNLIGILISIELILNAASINFLAFNKFVAPDKGIGQVVVILIIGLAAAEVTLALSIILVLYRGMTSINIEQANNLKG